MMPPGGGIPYSLRKADVTSCESYESSSDKVTKSDTTDPQRNISAICVRSLWLATLTAEPLGLGSNFGKSMDVCKCIVPLWHRDTLNSRRAANPLVRLVEGEYLWEAPTVFSL
ncbi:hypothetical protein TNCV_4644931 [Trichonephila clavipes]|nr:hypothetical protein TNCV_4644931 [Trichonephila clavipes]